MDILSRSVHVWLEASRSIVYEVVSVPHAVVSEPLNGIRVSVVRSSELLRLVVRRHELRRKTQMWHLLLAGNRNHLC